MCGPSPCCFFVCGVITGFAMSAEHFLVVFSEFFFEPLTTLLVTSVIYTIFWQCIVDACRIAR